MQPAPTCIYGHPRVPGSRCRECQLAAQRDSARKRLGKSAREKVLPLTPSLMKTLGAIYHMRPSSTADADEIAAEMDWPDLSVVYVMTGRLVSRGLVTSEKEWREHPETGREVNYVTYEITDAGCVLIEAWEAFRKALGPVASLIDWEGRERRR